MNATSRVLSQASISRKKKNSHNWNFMNKHRAGRSGGFVLQLHSVCMVDLYETVRHIFFQVVEVYKVLNI